MDRGLPNPEFKLRPRHALFLLDLVIAVGIFVGVGRYYMSHRGSVVLAEKEKTRASVELEAKRLLTEADSVMQAETVRLQEMRADSVRNVEELNRRREDLQMHVSERDQLAQNVFQISDVVQGLQVESEKSAEKAAEYQSNLEDRTKAAEAAAEQLKEREQKLQETETKHEDAQRQLREAITTRTFEPASMFPERSGVVVDQGLANGDRVTGVQLQHLVRKMSAGELGFSVGFGLGSGDGASTKQVGLLLSRSLIHRRLGLDFSAGLSHLTNDTGEGDAGAYAGAALRISPFYKERFHFSVGAEADHGDFLPFVGIGLGRR
jgi:uncharacterized protein YoxC